MILAPCLIYCYTSPIDTLKSLLSRPVFSSNCQLWKNRRKQEGILNDVYDGRIWQQFEKKELLSGANYHRKMWPKNAIRRITVLQEKMAKYGRSNRQRMIFHRFLRTRVKRRPMEDDQKDSCSKTTTRKQKLLYCGRCSTKLPKSTYYRHRADYFVEVKQQWCIIDPLATPSNTSGMFTSTQYSFISLQDKYR